MTLRQKTLMMIGVTLLGLVIFLFAVSQIFLMGELNSMEEKTAIQDAMQANNIINQEMANLNDTTADWATWDDTYFFMGNNNSQYIQSNMVNSTFTNLNLDMVLFIDSSGNITYVKTRTNNTLQSSIPSGMENYISFSGILNLKKNLTRINGVINTPNGPILVSAQPILTSDGQGPSRGTLIMGRYLDGEELGSITNQTQLAINTIPIASDGMTNRSKVIYDSLQEESVFINSSDPNTIFAYTMIYDIQGKPGLIIETNHSRVIHNEVQNSFYYFLIIMISAGIIMGLSILIYLDRAVLFRLARINTGVRKIGKSKDFSARVELKGDDELTDLSLSINKMMGKLEKSHKTLQKSEEKFRQLAENMEEVFWIVDALNGNFIYVSHTYEGIWGRNIQELYQNPQKWLEYIHPHDKEIASGFFSERCGVKLQGHMGIEYRIIRSDGSLRWIWARLSPIEDEKGKVTRIVGIADDITKRKLAEEELIQTKDRLGFVLSATPAIIYTASCYEPYETTFISENIHKKLGYLPEEVVNQPNFWIDRIHPDDKKQVMGDMKILWDHGRNSYDYRFLSSNGNYRWMRDDANIITDENGNPKEIAGYWIDITKLKEAEIAQKQSESIYQTIFENTGTAIVMVEDDMTLSLVNAEFQLLFNFTKEEVEGKKKFTDLSTPEESERLINYHILLRKSPSSVPNSFETKFLDSKGEIRDVVIIMELIPGTKRSVASIMDVTEHKAAEKALLESEEKYKTLFESNPDYTILVGWDGAILDFNVPAEQIIGIYKGELVGKHFTELGIFPKEELELLEEKFLQLLQHEDVAPFESRIIDKDGAIRWGKTSLISIKKNNVPDSILVICSDITERKLAENKIIQSLKEKEVLLQEIHHRVKNNLQVISSLLSLQSRYIKDKDVLELFKESQNRVKSMTLVHEKLYQSHDVSQVDFNDYISELASVLFRSYGIPSEKVSLVLDVDEVSVDVNMAIPCGLIITELVTNSLKYAFPPGHRGHIKIAFKKKDSNYILQVEDNGVGIPENIDLEKSKSLGLRLVRTLTDQLGGHVEMEKIAGTAFKIVF
jgi:PAS domain S-box-containing protein